MNWPKDPRYHFELFFEKPDRTGHFEAYITIQAIRRPDERPQRSSFFDDEDDFEQRATREERDQLTSRLATRLDLPARFSSEQGARVAAAELAHRFVAGQVSADAHAVKRRCRDYQLIGGAGFRPDKRAWEPTLTIRRKYSTEQGGLKTQVIDGPRSPFRRNTYPTPHAAATAALDFGERMILNLVPGLKI